MGGESQEIASSIDQKCQICLERREKCSGQMMGELPAFRSEMVPPWSAVNMDLFGPIVIRGDCVKRGPRIFKKVYGVIHTCTRMRGIYLDVATDYSTESMLHTVRRLLAIKGEIQLIISDPESQIKGAQRESYLSRQKVGANINWSESELVKD